MGGFSYVRSTPFTPEPSAGVMMLTGLGALRGFQYIVGEEAGSIARVVADAQRGLAAVLLCEVCPVIMLSEITARRTFSPSSICGLSSWELAAPDQDRAAGGLDGMASFVFAVPIAPKVQSAKSNRPFACKFCEF